MRWFRNPEAENPQSRMFQASYAWTSNIWGAVVAGIGGGAVMGVMGGILLTTAAAPDGRLFGMGLILMVIATACGAFPGNLIAATPFAVELEGGKELRLYAPFKKLYIPIEEVREVRSGFWQQGTIVKLSKRHGLMKSFHIHWAFGNQRTQLARALEDEIARREPR